MAQRMDADLPGFLTPMRSDVPRNRTISGNVDWQSRLGSLTGKESYSLGAGSHTLKWVYARDSSGSAGDDCASVDFVQWTGPSPARDPANWMRNKYGVPNGTKLREFW